MALALQFLVFLCVLCAFAVLNSGSSLKDPLGGIPEWSSGTWVARNRDDT
jgi:hypothetical protein